jgi:pyruvate, water dikinase
MRSKVNRAVKEIDLRDPVGLRRTSHFIRSLIEAVPMDPDIEAAIRASYRALCERCGVDDVPVAVRSSATAEDLPDASFAGQQDTFLWITGADAVVENVKRCWSSIFTDRAISYRHETGHDHEIISMSVGIQKMVEPKAAGVAFTLNPSDGDRSQVAIDASWGFGEAVVSGEVTPDNFLVDKVLLEIVKRTISPKVTEYRLNGAGAVEPCESIRIGRRRRPSRRRGQGGGGDGQARRASLRVAPGRGVGDRPPPPGRRQRHPSPEPARDGVEPQASPAGGPPGRAG